jgi:hypothetical protein
VALAGATNSGSHLRTANDIEVGVAIAQKVCLLQTVINGGSTSAQEYFCLKWNAWEGKLATYL